MPDDSPWMPPGDGGASGDGGATPTTLPPAAPSLPSLPDVPPSPPPASLPPQPPTLPHSPWAPGASPAPPPPPGAPAPSATPPPFAAPTAPVVGQAVDGPRRSNWLVAGALAAVIAVVAAGVFAIVNLTSASTGGSATADELGFELFEAIENEDVLGVIDLLLPGERDAFRGPLVDIVSELTRLEILSGDFDLGQLAGLDIEFDRATSEVRTTNVDDIVNIDLRADATVSIDGADLPIGDLFTDNLPDDVVTELRGSRATEVGELDISLTAVDHDGRWYFSVFHTVAELARRDLAPGTPIPSTGVGSDGADTPEAAVDQLLERLEDLDLTGLIRTLNPGEAAALQRYAPLFIEDAQAEIDAAPFDWEIVDRTVRIEGEGDRRTAFLDAITIEGSADGIPFRLAVDGTCVSALVDGDTFEQCGNDFEAAGEVFDDTPAVREFFDTLAEAFADIEPAGLELRRADDGWYVSVTETMSEAMLVALRALDREELDEIIDAAADAISEVFGVALDSIDDLAELGAELSEGDVLDDGLLVSDPDLGALDDLESLDDLVDSLDEIEDTPYLGCYDEETAADAIACFQPFLASGELAAWELPVSIRFPECGYADLQWTGEIYGLDDDEFIAAATAARPCFLDLVEQGAIEEWELPTEITDPECFEGRNWYNVFDDPDYDERYYECVTASFDSTVLDG